MMERISMKGNKLNDICLFDKRFDVFDNNMLFVCVIELGLMYFGYVYFIRVDLKDIFCFYWNLLIVGMIYLIFIVIFLDEKQNFLGFGYEVEEKYLELDVEEKKSCYFF